MTPTAEQVEKMIEALKMYADDMFYFPRGIVLECQKKGMRLAPCYSEFGEKAKEALAVLTPSESVETEGALKPCPFCGGKAKEEEAEFCTRIVCQDCYVEARTIKQWNTRHIEAADLLSANEEIERLRVHG